MELYNEYEEKQLEQTMEEGRGLNLVISLDKLLEDPLLQLRTGHEERTVNELYAQINLGEKLPPLVAFYDEPEEKHWLADGLYRKKALKKAGESTSEVIIYRGTRRDALVYAIKQNTKHGVPLTHIEKRQAVLRLHLAYEGEQVSDNWISRLTKVSQPTVGRLRRKLAAAMEEPSYKIYKIDPLSLIHSISESQDEFSEQKASQPTRVFRKGQEFLMNTQKIGRARAKLLTKDEWHTRDEERRQERHAEAIEKARLQQAPEKLGPFTVLYVDPPWRYNVQSSNARAIENHYPTLTLEELCDLDVPSICAETSTLYLWVTVAMLEDAFTLLRAWGFQYKTHDVWHKLGGLGMGHRNRVDHEILFTAIRGNFPTPTPAQRSSSIWALPRGKHSEKPKEFREHIEKLFPEHLKVELFAREKAVGWTSIGNEIDGRDIRDVLGIQNRRDQ